MQRFDDKAWPVYSASQIRAIERDFAKQSGQGTYPLMLKAGRAAYALARKLWPWSRRWLVICGKGNNGGDGYIVAQLASQAGIQVELYPLADREKLTGDARRARDCLDSTAIQVLSHAEFVPEQYDLIVDAMLGTGIQGELRAPYDEVVHKVNQSRTPVLSLDIPSGLNSDTGVAAKQTVKADATITFVGVKKGLVTADAFDHTGHLYIDQLDLNPTCSTDWQTLTAAQATTCPPRPRNSHKGMFGHLLVIGGARGMQGAAALAGTAALNSGAGKVTVCCEESPTAILARQPQLMARSLSVAQVAGLMKQMQEFSALVVGPGLGRNDWGRELWQVLVETPHFEQLPKIVDADGLYWLAQAPRTMPNCVLTPHPGEAALLLNCGVKDIVNNRFAAAKAIAEQFHCICLLKGAGTLISQPKGSSYVLAKANPELAVAGMGDVLSGMIGARIARGENLLVAAREAAYWHVLGSNSLMESR